MTPESAQTRQELSPVSGLEKFSWLLHAARDLGAWDARIIETSQVFVENRVPLKCKTGCPTYGTRLTCPLYAPTPEEFRKILAEYQYTLVVKFRSRAKVDPLVVCSVNSHLFDPAADPQKKEQAALFMQEYIEGNNERVETMLGLEKRAFQAGYPFALAMVNGSCRLCKTCNIEKGICLHATRARYPEHAVGVNMIKTAEHAGMPIQFPVTEYAEPMALLLID